METYWSTLDPHQSGLESCWLAHPLVMQRVNERISGDPARGGTVWLAEKFRERLPFRRALSIGCGPGHLERDLVRQNIVQHVTGVDLAPAVLHEATKLAAAEGLQDRVSYVAADARELLAATKGFDAIFFHASLHHFDRLDELMRLVHDALLPDGLLYVDEFVGPSMHEWRWWRLLLPNLVYYLLPRGMRRPKLVRKPLNPDDPTEAICAGEILGALERQFRIIDRRDYGGHLIALLYPNLRQPAPGESRDQFDRAIRFLLRLEDAWLHYAFVTRARTYYAVVAAMRKNTSPSFRDGGLPGRR